MATTMLALTIASTFTTNVNAAELQTRATVSETTIAGDDRYETSLVIANKITIYSTAFVVGGNGEVLNLF